jgi:hypothetical protein
MALPGAQNLGTGLPFDLAWVTLPPLKFPGFPGFRMAAILG